VSRASLKPLLWIGLALAAVTDGVAQDPHVDPSLVPDTCNACHAGHGVSRSPMLRNTQVEVCLECHNTPVKRDEAVRKGMLETSARPPLLGPTLRKLSTHPLTAEAFSSHEPGAVTCTSCHSAHRSSPLAASRESSDGKRLSPKNANRFEFEMCQDCHGSAGAATEDEADISRLFNPNSRSFHPVEAPSREGSGSVLPGLAGSEIGCSDCHGNSDPTGPRGPHGSDERFLLKARYVPVDGDEESATTYGLCYRCHDRERVLDSDVFPEHRRHVVDLRASCSTCHNPHGSVNNRALLRFDEQIGFVAAAPSIAAGRLAFESNAPGNGACYVTCHGYDHDPVVYGWTTRSDDPDRRTKSRKPPRSRERGKR